VTLGGYYGTNRCKLVGAYILNIITQQHGENFGLYRDYGLGATNKTPKERENVKKRYLQNIQ